MKNLEKILLPTKMQESFELESIEETESSWVVKFIEKKERIPTAAQHRQFGKKLHQNGYLKPIEITDFPLKGKICYLQFKRRRWKIEGTKESYHNHYKLHPKGLKCTIEFGDFLKGLGRRGRRKFFLAWSNIRHIREEDFSLVSRIKRVFGREEIEE